MQPSDTTEVNETQTLSTISFRESNFNIFPQNESAGASGSGGQSENTKKNESMKFFEATHSELLGKEVKSGEEAFELYNEYAFRKCFSVRKNNKRCRKDGSIKLQTMVCSKAGEKRTNNKSTRLYSKVDFRTGCKATISFNVDSTGCAWTVVGHKMEHNHPFCDPNEVEFLRSHRKVPEDRVELVRTMKQVGVTTADAYRYLTAESGGSAELGFMKKDLYNAMQSDRKTLEGCDANNLLQILCKRGQEEQNFYYSFEVDDESRLINIFWRDGKMKEDYRLYGDLLVHDTTYRTNRCNMICAPFVGMNNHCMNIMFGCGFLLNEKAESFVWLFTNFLSSMNEVQPQTIMTDQCPAMSTAIDQVFPQSKHRLCVWHIIENSKKHIAHLLNRSEGFSRQFQYILRYCETEAEFNHFWSRLMDDHGCQRNSWLIRTYQKRDQWSRAFCKDYFSGGALSSQRSESTNHSISRKMRKTSTLSEFYETFCNVIAEWRKNREIEDWKCSNGIVDMMVDDVKLLIDASKVYTHEAYRLFEDQFRKSLSFQQEIYKEDEVVTVYSVWQADLEQIRHMVTYNKIDSVVSCTCKLITEAGILCSHCIRILVVNCVQYLDGRYINDRWKHIQQQKIHDTGESSSLSSTSKWKMMMRRKLELILTSSEKNSAARVRCEKSVDKLAAEIEGRFHLQPDYDETNTDHPSPIDKVLNPPGATTKGRKDKRMVSTVRAKYDSAKKRHKNSVRTSLQKKDAVQSMMVIDKDAQSVGVSFAHPIDGGASFTRIIPNLDSEANII